MAIFAEVTKNEHTIDRHLCGIHLLLDYDWKSVCDHHFITALHCMQRGLLYERLSVCLSVRQTRELWQTKALSEQWLIGSRPRAFQRACGEHRTLPLTPSISTKIDDLEQHNDRYQIISVEVHFLWLKISWPFLSIYYHQVPLSHLWAVLPTATPMPLWRIWKSVYDLHLLK